MAGHPILARFRGRWQRVPRWVRVALVMTVALLAWARWWPMDPLFTTPRSTLVTDRNGLLLGALVASDGQWRMPSTGPVPERFAQCLIAFEDRHFREHFGIHPPSLVRAWEQNRKADRVISGGSTITMQLARMALGTGERTYVRKIREMLLALRIEQHRSKDWILGAYADNAPFGGNVVGLEAAAWRWFGRPADRLSWAESATLAVLPNAPAQIHPGRNRAALRDKRDRLLRRLLADGTIDSTTMSLSLDEPLPDAPLPMPRLAPHVVHLAERHGHVGQLTRTTMDAELQERVTRILKDHAVRERANEVHNGAVLVMDIATGEVLAYVGNVPGTGPGHAEAVDLVQAPRSTGSLLKTFLHAAMIDQGELMPDQLVADLPTQYDGFAPRNFSEGYDGAVPASHALARSLNVPAVRALRQHGIHRTLTLLRSLGLAHLDKSAEHYGLSLIIGGAESTLWEMTGAYASLGRILLQRSGDPSLIPAIHPPRIWAGAPPPLNAGAQTRTPLGAGAIHHTLHALLLTHRPESEAGWEYFDAPSGVAWKTGTSFGHRDAWAIGLNGRHAVGIWVGNAHGEGRPGLTGTRSAAPILFDVIRVLPEGKRFPVPYEDLVPMAVCRASGFRAGIDCPEPDTLLITKPALRTGTCPYHHRIRVNGTATERVGAESVGHMVSWFILPPGMEYFHRKKHPEYRPMPPGPDAGHADPTGPLAVIYPEDGSRLFLPMLANGRAAELVLQAAHRYANEVVHWDLNGAHMGSTIGEHRLAIPISTGSQRLTLTDASGHTTSVRFTVVTGTATTGSRSGTVIDTVRPNLAP